MFLYILFELEGHKCNHFVVYMLKENNINLKKNAILITERFCALALMIAPAYFHFIQ